MPEGFVPLDVLVGGGSHGPAVASPAPNAAGSGEAPRTPGFDDIIEDFASELLFARLAALEAFERAVPRLLENLARDVLARELTVAGPDLAALARDVLADFAAQEPVALVVAPSDIDSLGGGLPLRADARLAPGDLVVEVRDGEVDARFSLRLHDAIATAHAPGNR